MTEDEAADILLGTQDRAEERLVSRLQTLGALDELRARVLARRRVDMGIWTEENRVTYEFWWPI